MLINKQKISFQTLSETEEEQISGGVSSSSSFSISGVSLDPVTGVTVSFSDSGSTKELGSTFEERKKAAFAKLDQFRTTPIVFTSSRGSTFQFNQTPLSFS